LGGILFLCAALMGLFVLRCKTPVPEVPMCNGIASHDESAKNCGVLLLHGFGVSPQFYESLIPALKEMELSYEAPMITHQANSLYSFYQTSRHEWRELALKSFDKLREDCDKVIVIGFSMGGLLSLDLLRKRQADGVLLLAPYLGFHPWVHRLSVIFIRLFSRIPFLAVPNWSMDCSDPQGVKGVYRVPMTPFRSVRELIDLREEVIVNLEALKLPKKAVCWHSTGDNVASYRNCRKQLSSLSGLEFRTLNKSRHYLLQDIEGDLIRKEIKEILATEFRGIKKEADSLVSQPLH